jgi:hypothetical protein
MSIDVARMNALLASARSAIDGGREPEGIRVYRGKRRVDVFGEALRPLRTVLAALVFWSLVFLRASMGAPVLDPYGLVLRVLALGATLRAFLAIRSLVRSLPGLLAAEKNALVVAPEGLVIRARGRDRAIPRERLLGVHPGTEDAPPVLLLAPEAGEAILPLPPGLEDPRGSLTEALEGVVGPAGDHPLRDDVAEPLEGSVAGFYDRAAAGEVAPLCAVIARGRDWLAHGPYGALLVAVALLERLARLPAGASIGALGYGVVALSIALPLGWLLPGLRRARAARGVAAILTPGELLVRMPERIMRVRWPRVVDVAIGHRTIWSTVGGYRRLRTLHVRSEEGADVALHEEVLAVDPEALAALMDVYRRGRVAEASRL